MRENFQMFASYNGWANYRVYMAASKLSDDEYRKDCGVFFKSMHGTLNHILVADLIWMGRFEGVSGAPTKLDATLYKDLSSLLEARRELDNRIIGWTNELTDDQIAGDFTYMPITEPAEVTAPLGPCVAHFFNHQTHHRGHAHAILTQLTGDAPSLDMVEYFRGVREARSN